MTLPRRDNVQGLIAQRYHYPLARHFLFAVDDATIARATLRSWLPQVTLWRDDLTRRPEPLLNIGVSWNGLAALIPSRHFTTAAEAFPREFRDPPPARMAGQWKGQFSGSQVHLVVNLHCRSLEALETASNMLRGAAAGFIELKPNPAPEPAISAASLGNRRLHFGFVDGISEPPVNWDDVPGSNLVDLRNLLLGYWSPTVQSFPRDGVWAELVRDGSYGAFQWLRQYTASFEQFLTANAPRFASAARPLNQAREFLAAKMMGRWRDGTPLALSPEAQDPTTVDRSFGYADDPKGQRCPLTAHVRLANPRDQPLNPLVADSVPAGGAHLWRRGLPYGPELKGEADDGVDRGLVGLFFCANLQAQFFTLMNWINKADFSPAFDFRRLRWQDMIAGDRGTPGAVSKAAIPIDGKEVELTDLPPFITVQGTLLLLYPGLSGLTQIASMEA